MGTWPTGRRARRSLLTDSFRPQSDCSSVKSSGQLGGENELSFRRYFGRLNSNDGDSANAPIGEGLRGLRNLPAKPWVRVYPRHAEENRLVRRSRKEQDARRL